MEPLTPAERRSLLTTVAAALLLILLTALLRFGTIRLPHPPTSRPATPDTEQTPPQADTSNPGKGIEKSDTATVRKAEPKEPRTRRTRKKTSPKPRPTPRSPLDEVL